MTLRLVQPGDTGDDGEVTRVTTEAALKLVECVKAGGRFWLLLDGEEVDVCHVGDALEMAAVAEEVSRDVKRAMLGL